MLQKSTILFILLYTSLFSYPQVDSLYTDLNDIPNPPFEELGLPDQQTYNGPVYGSTIDVNNELVEKGLYAVHPIENNIRIHCLCNSQVDRIDFHKFSRWYQEDGKTQVFRLFKGEENTRNTRDLAARIEAHGGNVSWHVDDGVWHEWMGMYTIIKAENCMIFQAKNNINHWSVALGMNSNGDITLNHRRHQSDVVIARNMVGKSFNIRVRDNGHDYEVYLNGSLVGKGYFDRPEGKTNFRWGMYKGANEVKNDALLFVTGAKIDPERIPEAPLVSMSSLPNDLCRYDTVSVNANASTTFGDITKLELFLNDSLLQSGDKDSMLVNFQVPVTGIYALRAVASTSLNVKGVKKQNLEVGRCGIPLIPSTMEMENFSASSNVVITDAKEGGIAVLLESGDWLSFLVDIEEKGSYQLEFQAKPLQLPVSVEILQNSQPVDTLIISNTGKLDQWNSYLTILDLNDGFDQSLEFRILEGSIIIDKIDVIHYRTREKYPGKDWKIPGIINAVYFDLGGEGVAYHDADEGWITGLREDNPRYPIAGEEDVEIEEYDGIFNLSYTCVGEWLKYTVDTVLQGIYNIHVVGSSNAIGGQVIMHLGNDSLGVVNISSTSSKNWNNYKEFTLENITLPNKIVNDVLTLEITHTRYENNLCNIRSIEFERVGYIGIDGDIDGDGIEDNKDNCVNTPNPDQEDIDADGIGDICDDHIEGNSLDEKSNNMNIRVFPNPVEDHLLVLSKDKLKHISIINMNGQKVKEIVEPDLSVEIPVVNLYSGLYLMQFLDYEMNTHNLRLLKK